MQYSVAEAYVPGYNYVIQKIDASTQSSVSWSEATEFRNNEVYVLGTKYGFLSTQAADPDTLCYVLDEAVAKESPLALWRATVSNNRVSLTNLAGQVLNFDSSMWCFNAPKTGTNTVMTPYDVAPNGLILVNEIYHHEYYTQRNYMGGILTDRPYLQVVGDAQSSLVLHPQLKTVSDVSKPMDGYAFSITNTPLKTETSVKVIKKWEHPFGDTSSYEKLKITVKLLANGIDTGRTETIDLQSDWEVVFQGLPYADEDGVPIVYEIAETWEHKDWIPVYGEAKSKPGTTPTYEITLTNKYRWTDAYELPSTGGIGYPLLILIGLILISAPFVYEFSLWRRHRKGARI